MEMAAHIMSEVQRISAGAMCLVDASRDKDGQSFGLSTTANLPVIESVHDSTQEADVVEGEADDCGMGGCNVCGAVANVSVESNDGSHDKDMDDYGMDECVSAYTRTSLTPPTPSSKQWCATQLEVASTHVAESARRAADAALAAMEPTGGSRALPTA